MAQTELILPKMGESVAEATITKWMVAEGDTVSADQSIVEIATDKVDSEIPAPVAGVLLKILCAEGETVAVGTAIAIIGEAGEQPNIPSTSNAEPVATEASAPVAVAETTPTPAAVPETVAPEPVATKVEPAVGAAAPVASVSLSPASGSSDTPRFHKGRFFSPLVRKIAEQENVGIEELEKISGNGQNGRVTKKDILTYIQNRVAPQGNSTGSTVSAPQQLQQLQWERQARLNQRSVLLAVRTR